MAQRCARGFGKIVARPHIDAVPQLLVGRIDNAEKQVLERASPGLIHRAPRFAGRTLQAPARSRSRHRPRRGGAPRLCGGRWQALSAPARSPSRPAQAVGRTTPNRRWQRNGTRRRAAAPRDRYRLSGPVAARSRRTEARRWLRREWPGARRKHPYKSTPARFPSCPRPFYFPSAECHIRLGQNLRCNDVSLRENRWGNRALDTRGSSALLPPTSGERLHDCAVYLRKSPQKVRPFAALKSICLGNTQSLILIDFIGLASDY